MGFTLGKVAPWGRSYDEYVNMLGLTEKDLSLRILGCGDGPAAFNATLTKRRGSVVSVDPVYVFDTAQIKIRVAETYEAVMVQMHKNQDNYVWEDIPSVEQPGKIRISAMEDFLADFSTGSSASGLRAPRLQCWTSENRGALEYQRPETNHERSDPMIYIKVGHFDGRSL